MAEKFTGTQVKKHAESTDIRIRKGQAFNLAVNRAVEEGVADDTSKIFSYFIKYYEMAALVQSSSIEDIKAVLGE